MSSHPDYMGVWCPTCKEDCLPISGGRCGFCETRVIDTDGNPITTKETQQVEATCKIDGCTNPSAGKGGSWHGMCDEHISAEARRRQAVRFGKEPSAKPAKPKAVKPPPGRSSCRTERERPRPSHTDPARAGRRGGTGKPRRPDCTAPRSTRRGMTPPPIPAPTRAKQQIGALICEP